MATKKQINKEKPLTMKHLFEMIIFLQKQDDENKKRISLLELNVEELLHQHKYTVNPMLLRHETEIHQLQYRPWWKRLLGL